MSEAVVKKCLPYSTLTLAYDGALALITLNRPEKRNAISYELIDEFCARWTRSSSRLRRS